MKTGHRNQYKKKTVYTNIHHFYSCEGTNTQAQTDRQNVGVYYTGRCSSYTVPVHWQAKMKAWVWICVDILEFVWHMLFLHSLGKRLKGKQKASIMTGEWGWWGTHRDFSIPSFFPLLKLDPTLGFLLARSFFPQPTVNSHTSVGPQRRDSETNSCSCCGSH